MISCDDPVIKEEQDRLVSIWYNSGSELDIYDFAYQNGSVELRNYFDNRKKRDEEDRKNGWITN